MEPVNLSILVVNCKQYIPSYNWYFCKTEKFEKRMKRAMEFASAKPEE